MKIQVLVLFLTQYAVVKSSHSCDVSGSWRLVEPTASNLDGTVQRCSGIWYYINYNHAWTDMGASMACSNISGCTLQGTATAIISSLPCCDYYCNNFFSTSSCAYGQLNVVAGIRCAPEQPNVTSYEIYSTSISLSWIPSISTCINNYSVGCNIATTHIATTPTSITCEYRCSINITDLQPYTEYNCCVTAHYNSSSSIPSCLNDTTLPVAPSPPRGVGFSSLRSTSARVSWSPPLFPNGSVQYTVNCRNSGGGSIYYIQRYSRLYIYIYQFQPYTTYTCCVSASNDVGRSSESCVSFRTRESVPSGAPIINQSTRLQRSLYLEWEPPPLAQQNGNIVQYTVEIQQLDSDTEQLMQNYTTTQTRFTVPRLRPYRLYRYRVAAHTSVGVGPFTSFLLIRTLEDVPSGAPIVNESRQIPASRSLYLEWHPPSPHQQNGIITSYTIEIEKPGTGLSQYNTSDTTFTVVGLHPYSVYKYRLVAHTSVGEGPFTNFSQIQTLQDVPSGRPHNISWTVLSPTSFHLKWAPLVMEDRNGIIIGYRLLLEGDSGPNEAVEQHTSHTFAQLQQDTTYYFSVAAYTIKGTGPYSEKEVITTPKDNKTAILAGSLVGGLVLLPALCIICTVIAVTVAKKSKKLYGDDTVMLRNLYEDTGKLKQDKSKDKEEHYTTSSFQKSITSRAHHKTIDEPDQPNKNITTSRAHHKTISEQKAGKNIKIKSSSEQKNQTSKKVKKSSRSWFISKTHHKTTRAQSCNKAANTSGEVVDDTIPELPVRGYLDDIDFVCDLDVPEVTQSSHQDILDGCMLPQLPERRYLEDTDFELEAPPAIPQKMYSDEQLDQPQKATLSIQETTCKKTEANKGAGKDPSQKYNCHRLQGLYMNVAPKPTNKTSSPKSTSARKEKSPPMPVQQGAASLPMKPSEGQYMSLCEATKDKREAYQNSKEDHYMSLNESTRERARFTPWGQGFN